LEKRCRALVAVPRDERRAVESDGAAAPGAYGR
jgi:hypothetical protein